MEVQFAPDVEAKIEDLAGRAGVSATDLVQGVVSRYIDGLTEIRATLDSRYDDLRAGSVEAIDGDEFFDQLRAREAKLLNDKAS